MFQGDPPTHPSTHLCGHPPESLLHIAAIQGGGLNEQQPLSLCQLLPRSSRNLALLTLKEGGTDDATRLTWSFRRCVSRPPSDHERNVLLKLLAQQTTKFSAADAKPWELAANDPAKPPTLPANATPAQAAAWTAVSRVLLNLDETVTKD